MHAVGSSYSSRSPTHSPLPAFSLFPTGSVPPPPPPCNFKLCPLLLLLIARPPTDHLSPWETRTRDGKERLRPPNSGVQQGGGRGRRKMRSGRRSLPLFSASPSEFASSLHRPAFSYSLPSSPSLLEAGPISPSLLSPVPVLQRLDAKRSSYPVKFLSQKHVRKSHSFYFRASVNIEQNPTPEK